MKRAAAILAVIALGASLPQMAQAQGRAGVFPDSLGAGWRPQQDEARRGVRQGSMVPLEAVVGRIGRRTPGRMLDTGIEQWGGQTVYRVRWQAADGRRIDYIVDAASGNIIRAQGE